MANKINYTNKVALDPKPEIADINKGRDVDWNEVKAVVNNNADEIDANSADVTQLQSDLTATQVDVVTLQNRLDPSLRTFTGNTIAFDGYNEYNAVTPLTSGNITIDPTGAVAGAYASVYYNGATEPTISGATEELKTGTFEANALNIFHFFWNTNGSYVLNIQSVASAPLPQLTTPSMNAVAGDTLIDLTFSSIDANATTNVLESSTDNVNFSAVVGYNGTDLTYQDTGLTNGTTYYYRYKSQAAGYQDSEYATTSAQPSAGSNLILDNYTGSVAAYGLHQLRTGETYGVRVRRANDQAQADILFDGNGKTSLTSLTTNTSNATDGQALSVWGASTNVRVVTWYDQSGTGNDITQATNGEQPSLMESDILVTKGGESAIDFLSDTRSLSLGSAITALDSVNDSTVFSVAAPNVTEVNGAICSNSDAGNTYRLLLDSRTTNGRHTIQGTNSTVGTCDLLAPTDTLDQRLYTSIVNGSVDVSAWYNGSAQTQNEAFSGISENTDFVVGDYSANELNGTIQLLIIYPTVRADRALIEADINTHFSIY